MSLASIDKKLFAFYALETFANNFLSIDARDIKILPFNAHRYDESIEPYFVFLRSLTVEIMQFYCCVLATDLDFW